LFSGGFAPNLGSNEEAIDKAGYKAGQLYLRDCAESQKKLKIKWA
jgi:hypothetical protein